MNEPNPGASAAGAAEEAGVAPAAEEAGAAPGGGRQSEEAAAFTWSRHVEPIYNRENLRKIAPAVIAGVVASIAGCVVAFAIAPLLGFIIFATLFILAILLPILSWWQGIIGGSLNPTVFTLDPMGASLVRSSSPTKAGEFIEAGLEVASLAEIANPAAPVYRSPGVRPRIEDVMRWREVASATCDEKRHVVHLMDRRGRRLCLYASAAEWPEITARVRAAVGRR